MEPRATGKSDIFSSASIVEAEPERLQPGLKCERNATFGSQALKDNYVTDQERQKAEELISRIETAVGQIFPRDSGNSTLIASMLQSLNGLRSLVGVVRPH